MAKKVIYCDCSECKNETKHEVLFTEKQATDVFDDRDRVTSTEYESYSIITCLGCENISFLHTFKMKPKKGAGTIEFETIYPEHDKKSQISDPNFLTSEESSMLPILVRNLYEEIEFVASMDTPILTGIGLRTLLEAICIHQNIKGRNLKEKIDNLYKDGLIAAKDLPILHNLREIGNVTVHQIKKPSTKVLDYSLEILIHTLKSLYVMPRIHAKIYKRKTT